MSCEPQPVTEGKKKRTGKKTPRGGFQKQFQLEKDRILKKKRKKSKKKRKTETYKTARKRMKRAIREWTFPFTLRSEKSRAKRKHMIREEMEKTEDDIMIEILRLNRLDAAISAVEKISVFPTENKFTRAVELFYQKYVNQDWSWFQKRDHILRTFKNTEMSISQKKAWAHFEKTIHGNMDIRVIVRDIVIDRKLRVVVSTSRGNFRKEAEKYIHWPNLTMKEFINIVEEYGKWIEDMAKWTRGKMYDTYERVKNLPQRKELMRKLRTIKYKESVWSTRFEDENMNRFGNLKSKELFKFVYEEQMFWEVYMTSGINVALETGGSMNLGPYMKSVVFPQIQNIYEYVKMFD